MSLTPNTFTRENIETVLLNGRSFDEYPSVPNPVFIIKVGPPGSGKSSARSRAEVESIIGNQSDAILIDIDKVNAAFQTFRNQTRKLRNNYPNKNNRNSKFFNRLTRIHKNHSSNMKNTSTGRPMTYHTTALISKAIKAKKHIIQETIRPIGTIMKMYGPLLRKYNYHIYALFHRTPIEVLKMRVYERGEELYRTEGYYRAFNPEHLQNVINALETNLTDTIIPAVEAGDITAYKIIG